MPAALRHVLDDLVPAALARLGVPGAAVGVLRAGKELTAGYGVTSVEDPLPVHAETLFQIGSVSKTFTATALMRLVEQGALALDDPVRRHLPTFRLSADGLAERVTVRHLLTHTAGWLGDWFLVHPPDIGAGADALAVLLERMREVPQVFEPGAGWSYNNAGFAVAGRLLEVLTGRPFEAVLRETLLHPLGMTRTVFTADEAITRRVAAPHRSSEGAPAVTRGAGWQPGWELIRADLPLGGVVSCVADLLRWARFHLGEASGPLGVRPPLGPATLAAMREPLAEAGCFAEQVGVTWMLRTVEGHRLVGHGGLTTGYATTFLMVPERAFAVVVLTNATPGGTRLCSEVARAALRAGLGIDDAPPAPTPDAGGDPSPFVGRYDNPFSVQEVRTGEAPGELVLEHHARPRAPGTWYPPPPGPTRLAFYAPDRLVVLAPTVLEGQRCEFGRDSAGRIAWFRWGGRVGPRRSS